jgi:hypothetical protein
VALLAHWLYENDVNEIERDDLETVIQNYNQEYRESVLSPQLVKDLEDAQILVRIGTGAWKFAGSHMRDFFIAKYYAQALGDEESPQKKAAVRDIQLMIETIKYEPHTRILLFLVYEANSNRSLIRWILNEAARIYSGLEVANFESDVQFINELEQSSLDGNLLESGDPRTNQDKRDAFISDDESDNDLLTTSAHQKSDLVKYSDDADEFTKCAIALKMIELVGQLVKSFAGTIKAELKQDLIEECINVGLRLCRSLLDSTKNELKDLSDILKHLIRDQNPQRDN